MSGAPRVSKAMTQPLTVIFRFLQTVRSMSIACLRRPLSSCFSPPARLRLHPPLPCPASCVYPLSCQRTRIAVWLYEQSSLRIEGRIIGFDEFMNLVLDDAEEVPVAKGAAPAGPRRALGRILLKGGSPLRARQRACVPRAARVAAVCACVRRARVPPPRSSLPPRTEIFFSLLFLLQEIM